MLFLSGNGPLTSIHKKLWRSDLIETEIIFEISEIGD